MDAEAVVLPDNTVVDTSIPPPGFNYPKPDYTPIPLDDTSEVISPSDKPEGPLTKPTFKNVLQAKKRLQAFSSNRAGSLPTSPLAKKTKSLNIEEKSEDGTSPVKKTPKKGTYHDDKAKAVIEEIEELKREELQRFTCAAYIASRPRSRSRSTSKSIDKERFKKVDKKSRNYRKRSATPERPKKVHKKTKKYPKNWREFVEFDLNFELNREFDVASPKGNNELLRQLLFESPSLPVTQFKMKTVKNEEKNVPFDFIRYTRTKPILAYSANFVAIKEKYLPRKVILDALPKNIVANIENLHSNSLKFSLSTNDVTKVRNWFPKIWRDSENECKLLEKSVGLSFLQTYTGEEEENDFVEEEKKEVPDEKKRQIEEKKKQAEEKKEQPDEKKKQSEDKKGQPDEKKKQSEDKRESTGDKKEKTEKREESKNDKEQPLENENLESKNTRDDQKKKKKKSLEESTELSPEKKKKKKRDRKKSTDENADETLGKKKKPKKGKSKKKEKRSKEKKSKHKKPLKEKKKKDKSFEEEKSIENKTKQQVLEELKIIEDKLAKKREQDNKNKSKHEKEEKEKTRKRKHSERDDDAKRTKHEKHKIEHVRSEIVKIEPPKPKPQEKKVEKIEVPEIKSEEKAYKKQIEKIKPKSEELERKEKFSARKKKSRWSEPVKIEEIPFPEKMNIAEEIKRIDEVLKKHEEITRNHKMTGEQKIEEIPIKEKTPDTDEYHSHWESDDDISHKRQKLKPNRSWESDEELFERKYNANKTQSESYTNLEIPLNIKTFSRRGKWNEEPPLTYIDTLSELKLLEEERKNLSEERKKLEIEKQRILKMQENKLEDKKPAIEQPKEIPPAPEPEAVKVKKEILDFNFDSLNNSLLSNVSSNESNFPIAALENEYEEFIKAVSSDPSPSKKKQERRSSVDSTSSSSSSSSDSDHKKKKRKKKKKKKKKSRDCEGLLLGKGATIFNEFDIPVPSDLPEIVPTPVPVPSPILPIVAPNLLMKPIIDIKETETEGKDPGLDLTKPFVFSSIVLQSKKPALVESKLKLDDDSDSVDFTEKFAKKSEEPRKEEKAEEQELEMPKLEDIELPKPIEEIKTEPAQQPPETEEKKEVLSEVVAIKEKDSPKKEVKAIVSEEKKPSPEEHKVVEKARKRSRTRSREKDLRRRSPPRRREPTPLRRRYSSPPRRRSPGRRRASPRRRSPSPRRRLSPPRRRRRSPSLSPPRRGGRKRTPSPRNRRASPLNSPLDGFKRSVADSTISDDMLPQPTPEDYNGSPFYERKKIRSSLSPQSSPKRISLDDRINQVLGLEKNEPPKPQEAYPNYNNYNAYSQQYNQYTQYGQYGQQKSEYVAPFPQPFFTQPPPPIVKPVPPTKVVQVGNILQVVPSDEIPQPVIENKPQETSQKIVQVGNMLQIVPAVIPPTKQILEPPPQPVQPPEKQSAEALMKQKLAERKAEREKRRQERERRRKEKEKKRKEKEKRKQMKLKLKTENMIKRAIQLEAEALACEDLDEEGEGAETPVQWPPVSVVVSTTPSCKGILLGDGSSRKRKSVQFADGVRPGEGTSPSGGEELSSPPPHPKKLPKEKRYKKIKVPKKSKKRKIKVKVVKKKTVQNADEDDDDEDDNLPPPSPPPGSPPPHVFPSRVKTHTINNVHQYVGNIIQNNPAGFPFRPPMPVVINRHQPPPGFIPGTYHTDVNNLSHPYQGVSSHH